MFPEKKSLPVHSFGSHNKWNHSHDHHHSQSWTLSDAVVVVFWVCVCVFLVLFMWFYFSFQSSTTEKTAVVAPDTTAQNAPLRFVHTKTPLPITATDNETTEPSLFETTTPSTDDFYVPLTLTVSVSDDNDDDTQMVQINEQTPTPFDSGDQMMKHKKMEYTSKTNIPNILHICWRNEWMPETVFESIFRKNEAMTTDFDHCFYTNDSVVKCLSQHFPPDVLNTFLSINPQYGACLADFFRYCIMYIYGGIYIDAKARIRQHIRDLFKYIPLRGGDVLVVSHWPHASPKDMHAREIGNKHGEIMNWVFLCTPRHPFLKDMIDSMVHTIQEWCQMKYTYGEKINVLRLTGPIFMTKKIVAAFREDPDRQDIIVTSVLNNFFSYSQRSVGTSIRFDKKMYEGTGIKDYSSLSEPIVLFSSRPETSSSLEYVSWFETREPVPSDVYGVSLSDVCHDSGKYRANPIDLDNSTTTRDLIHTTLDILDIQDTVTRHNIHHLTERVVSPETKREILMWCVLLVYGGYFIDPRLKTFSSADDMLPWTTYMSRCDIGVILDQRRFNTTSARPIIFKGCLKFPARCHLVTIILRRLFVSEKDKKISSSSHGWDSVRDILVEKCGQKIPKRGESFSTVFHTESSETTITDTWIVGSYNDFNTIKYQLWNCPSSLTTSFMSSKKSEDNEKKTINVFQFGGFLMGWSGE